MIKMISNLVFLSVFIFVFKYFSLIAHVCHHLQTELSDGIAVMVGNNDRIQGVISQLEETCRAIEVSCPVCGSVALIKLVRDS